MSVSSQGLFAIQIATMLAAVAIITMSFMILRVIAVNTQPLWGGTAAGVCQSVAILVLDAVCLIGNCDSDLFQSSKFESSRIFSVCITVVHEAGCHHDRFGYEFCRENALVFNSNLV